MFFFPNQSFAEKTKEEIFKDLQKKYEKLNSIEVSFAMIGNSDIQGVIKAKKGNKYYLRMPVMTVVCNGNTVWNFNERDKKVIVSNFDKNAVGTFSIDKFFFSFLNDYLPDRLVREKSTIKKGIYMLSFIPKDKKKPNQMSDFKIWVSSTNEILSVEIDHNGTLQKFDVRNIKPNIKIKDSVFDLKPPKGVEVIDVR